MRKNKNKCGKTYKQMKEKEPKKNTREMYYAEAQSHRQKP